MPLTATDPVARENIDKNRQFWATYKWPGDGDEWSESIGGTHALWHTIIFPRLASFVPTGRLLEIAPGHGRCTQYLRRLCKQLVIVDLVPDCIAACQRRFGADPRITYAVNDGSTLPMIADASIDFAFTWDSLVHVEHETVRSYVHELARVLAPGGYAFLHHSNLAEHTDRFAQFDHVKDLHWRARTMSAALMREDCRAAGLRCVSQELIPWGTTKLHIDAFSLICRDPERSHVDPVMETRQDWYGEIACARRMARLYARGT